MLLYSCLHALMLLIDTVLKLSIYFVQVTAVGCFKLYRHYLASCQITAHSIIQQKSFFFMLQNTVHATQVHSVFQQYSFSNKLFHGLQPLTWPILCILLIYKHCFDSHLNVLYWHHLYILWQVVSLWDIPVQMYGHSKLHSCFFRTIEWFLLSCCHIYVPFIYLLG